MSSLIPSLALVDKATNHVGMWLSQAPVVNACARVMSQSLAVRRTGVLRGGGPSSFGNLETHARSNNAISVFLCLLHRLAC